MVHQWPRYAAFVLSVLACLCTESTAQRAPLKLRGLVLDSLTLEPLPYVTVINRTSNNGTTTDVNGNFSLVASAGDSILFSSLGYARKKYLLRKNETAVLIFMREFATTLTPVLIYSSYKPTGSHLWQSAMEKPRIIRNPAGPGSGYVVETFGPGTSMSIGGLITKMFKSEKEKRDLNTMREKAKQTETFRSVIMSEETKRYFQDTFQMSDADYLKFIEEFNIAHPDAELSTNKDDIIGLMLAFKATRRKP